MPNSINQNTKFPLYLVISAVTLAVYFTCWFVKLDGDMNATVNKDQFDAWLFNQIQANKTANASVNWTQLPAKQEQKQSFVETFFPK